MKTSLSHPNQTKVSPHHAAYTNATRQNKGAFAMAGSSGASKKVKMPLCTYGSACTRGKACVYRHPSKKSSTSSGNAARAPAPPAKVCLAHLAGTCTFGSRCFNRHPSEKESEELRKGYKQKKCLYGDDCRSMGCLYFHPREEEVRSCEGEAKFTSAYLILAFDRHR